MNLFGRGPIPQMFYPSLVWGSPAKTLDFDEPAALIRVARKPIRGQNISSSGSLETVFERFETTALLAWRHLPTDLLADIETYFVDWGAKGEQSVLTLDRFGTCAGQREYDTFNTFFTKAELMNDPWDPQRSTLSAPVLYTLELLFRQGT